MTNETNTTTEYGQIVPTTLTEDVTAALGEFENDYDIPEIVAEYRAAIQAALPEGFSVHGEGYLYGPWPRQSLDKDAVLEAVDFWAIAERHDTTQ